MIIFNTTQYICTSGYTSVQTLCLTCDYNYYIYLYVKNTFFICQNQYSLDGSTSRVSMVPPVWCFDGQVLKLPKEEVLGVIMDVRLKI